MSYNSFWALQAETCQDHLRQLHRELAGHFESPCAFVALDEAEEPPAPYEVENGIAIIRVSGVIDRAARISFFTGLPYTEGQDRIRAALEAALADSAVRGVLLSLNSPGGTVAGTKELADFIAQSTARKPLAAYADGLCASAAYWLAAATGKIYAPVTAQVGSIGVIAVLTDWTRAAEKAGVARTVLASGQWKAAGSPDKSLTDEERAMFQAQLERLHGIFKADVAARMGISAPESQWAEGQTILGGEALGLGLVSALARDQAQAAAMFAESLGKEEIMDQKQAPQGEKADAIRQAAAAARAEIIALAKLVAGEETAAKIEALANAGISPAQAEALSPMLATNTAKPAEAEARENVLWAISQATGGPLPGGLPGQREKSPLVADAERRANQRMVM